MPLSASTCLTLYRELWYVNCSQKFLEGDSSFSYLTYEDTDAPSGYVTEVTWSEMWDSESGLYCCTILFPPETNPGRKARFSRIRG